MSEMFDTVRITKPSYLEDESKMKGMAGNVILPFEEGELRDALRFANSAHTKVTVRGMGTGLCGGAVPMGGDVISLERMTGIVGVGVDEEGYFLKVQPCTTIREINDLLMNRAFDNLKDITPGAVESLRSEPVPYIYPVDPTELGGSIGGNIATNASGPRTYRYGPTRDWVRSMRVVLPDGNFIILRRGDYRAEGRRMSFPSGRNYYSFELPDYDFNTTVKNTAGPMISEDMDLMDLFIGSEGIFGIITEADIRIISWNPHISNLVFFPSDEDALAAVRELKGDHLVCPEFLEYMDCRSLDLLRGVMASDPALIRAPMLPEDAGSALFFDIEVTDDMEGRFARLSEILTRHNSSLDRSWCGHERGDMERLRELRHSIPRSIFEYVASLRGEMLGIHKMGTDMSVPDDSADEMMSYYYRRLQEEELPFVVFGHIGDNHPHVEIILRSMEDFEGAKVLYAEFAAKAVELGGSPSAEHGIGKIKTDYMRMMYGKETVDALRRVKGILDPNGILNIGDILEELE